MPLKVTEHILQQMHALKAQGLNKSQIAKQLGIARPTVFRYLGKDNDSYQKLPEGTIQAIINLRRERTSIKDIAKQLGVSHSSVQKIAHKEVKGLIVRPTSYVPKEPREKHTRVGRPTVDTDTTALIIELRKQGLYYTDIAKRSGISVRTISLICRAQGIEMGIKSKQNPKPRAPKLPKPVPVPVIKKSALSKEVQLRIKSLFLDGYTRTKIKDKLRLSFTTVSKALVDMGIDVSEKPKFKKRIFPQVYERISIPERRLQIEVYSPEEAERVRVKYGLV